MRAYANCLWNCDDFAGRLDRLTFRTFLVVHLLALFLFASLDSLRNGSYLAPEQPFLFFYGLASAIPLLASTVRRLHDAEWNGWWGVMSLPTLVVSRLNRQGRGRTDVSVLLLAVLVAIGLGLVLLICWFHPGTIGPNDHGPDPRQGREPHHTGSGR